MTTFYCDKHLWRAEAPYPAHLATCPECKREMAKLHAATMRKPSKVNLGR